MGFIMEKGRTIRILILAAVIAVLVFLLGGGFIFPASQEEKLVPSELALVTGDIQERLNEIAGEVETASSGLSGRVGGEEAQKVIDSAVNATPDAVYFYTFAPDGSVVKISPASYDDGDISPNADPLSELISPGSIMNGPAMSQVILYGGNPVFGIMYPVYDEKGDCTGGVGAIINSFRLLDEIVTPEEEASNSTFTVMQTDGLILYDMDEEQVNRNLFTDDIFSAFPNLRNLGVKFAANGEGYGSYMYYPTGGNGGRPVKKLAYWDSVGLYGTEWRVIMFKEVLS